MVDDVMLIFWESLREKSRCFGAQNPRTHMRTRSTLHNYCVKTSLLFKYFSAPGFQRSCFLRIFVSTAAIMYSKLFSLTLRKLDDAIWNMRSFLKTLGKSFLDLRFFINSIESSSIPSVHFGASSYALCIRNDLRIYAGHFL